jgi:hypothetical protein
MTVSRFALVDFRYTSDVVGHIRLYEAGNTYDMPPGLAHAAAKRDFVAIQRPVDWEPPSILLAIGPSIMAILQRAKFSNCGARQHRFLTKVDPWTLD